MVAQVFAEVPEWVADSGSWVGLLVGLLSLAGLAYGFGRWMRRSVVHAVGEIVDEKIDPLRVDIAEATHEARQVRDEHREHMRTEDAMAAESAAWRARVDEWQAATDIALRNLQQAQVPHFGPRVTTDTSGRVALDGGEA